MERKANHARGCKAYGWQGVLIWCSLLLLDGTTTRWQKADNGVAIAETSSASALLTLMVPSGSIAAFTAAFY